MTRLKRNVRYPRGAWPVLAAACLALCGCGKTPGGEAAKGPQQEAVPVSIAAAEERTIPVQVEAIGAVEAYNTVAIKTMVNGEIVGIHIQDGQDLAAGAPLFTLDSQPYDAAIRQNEANKAKNAALVKQYEAVLARDQAQLRQAETEAKRYADLRAKGVVSQQQADVTRTTVEALAATVQADQGLISATKEAMRVDQATIENARVQLGYCTIRAPFQGRAGSILVQKGNLAKSNDTILLTINQITPIYVTFTVPEIHLHSIMEYKSANTLSVAASIPGDPGPPAEGKLTFIDNAVDRTTGTVRLKAKYENVDRRLWPGQFVGVTLTLTQQAGAVTVPAQAVQTGQQGQYVYVVRPDSTVESRAVTVDRTVGETAVVKDGVKPGEQVVVDGQLKLVPGRKVRAK